MKVALLDLTRQYGLIGQEIKGAINSVLESQRFINGPVVEEFEKDFAAFCGSRFAVGCSSGTDALLMSLVALDIGPGDEVITVPFTFFATVEAIVRRGATPVFVDIDANTFNMDTTQLERAINSKTKAIMPVHLFGQCVNMDEVTRIAQKYNLKIIEDAAQAAGAKWSTHRAGSMGDMGCFSFFPAKNLGAYGDGGIVTTNDPELYTKMLRTRQHGIDIKNPYYYDHIGGNFRLDALQAAVLKVKLQYLEQWNMQRSRNAVYYNQRLENCSDLITPFAASESYHVYNQYVIRSQSRDMLRERLAAANIGHAVYYPYPIHTQRCMQKYGYRAGDFPVCEKTCSEVLALPVYPDLTREELDYVVETLVE